MDRLRRELAPVSEEAWKLIDQEAARTLRHFLSARSLVDFSGPMGWGYSSRPKGRTEPAGSAVEGTHMSIRQSTPVVEVRVPFTLERSELDAVDKGSSSPDLDAVIQAARRAAEVEDGIVFGGGPGGIDGLASASPHEPVNLSDDYGDYPRHVAHAVARLRRAGIGGPYAIALGDRSYTGVIETTEHGGYPVLDHVRLILGGPVVWAGALEGAVVLSIRGGDYEIFSGADFAVGYSAHSTATVDLYVEESLTFQVHEPKAAVVLRF